MASIPTWTAQPLSNARCGVRWSRCSRRALDDRAARSLQNRGQRRPAADHPSLARLLDRVRSVRGHRRAVRQRQVDPSWPAGRAGCAEHRLDCGGWRRHHDARRRSAGAAARREDRIRLSVLPPRAVADGIRECPDPDGDQRTQGRSREGASAARRGGPDGSGAPLSVAALGRGTAAHCHRPGARQRSTDCPRRRADRKPGLQHRTPHHGAVDAGPSRARHDAGAGHPRRRTGGARRLAPGPARRAAGQSCGGGGGPAMTFVVRMALREIRASWQRLLFFFICIAVGVAAIVTIRSVIQSVRTGLSREARTLTGADFIITSDREFTEKVRAAVERERREGRVTTVVNAMELATMVRPADGRPGVKMVELKAVEQRFPLYGTLTLESGAYSHALLRDGGALVRPELLAQFQLRVGDRIFIGTRAFEIRGVIREEPGRNVGAFSIGPRVLIDYADVPSTGLLAFGSRASRQMLLVMPRAGTEQAETNLRAAFANEFVRGRGYWSNADRMGQNLQRAENYLSLVGLVVLILGGIGVSSVTRVFVQQKVRSIAILKCVGSTTGRILAIYLTQVVLLGIAGSILGVALPGGVIAALPLMVGDVSALLQADYGLTPAAVVQGLAIGLLVSALFSLVPLLDIRHVKPGLLLRQDAPGAAGFDWLKWIVTAVVAAALVGVASWQAGSLTVGLVLSVGFVAVAVVLHVAGIILVRAVQPLRHARSFALRHAVLHVGRRGNQTRVILLAVGLGAFFILGVRTLQANLLRDFSVQVGNDAPDMFPIAVQPGPPGRA